MPNRASGELARTEKWSKRCAKTWPGGSWKRRGPERIRDVIYEVEDNSGRGDIPYSGRVFTIIPRGLP